MALRRPDHRPATQCPVVHRRRAGDIKEGDLPELRRRFRPVVVKLSLGVVALEIVLRLAARDGNDLPIPARRLGPDSADVGVEPQIVRALLEGVIVGLVARGADVRLDLAEPVAGILGESCVRAGTSQRRRARVEPVRQKSSRAGAAVGPLEVARARLLAQQNLAPVARHIRHRCLRLEAVHLLVPRIEKVVAIHLGVLRQPGREGVVEPPGDAAHDAPDDEVSVQIVLLQSADEIVREGLYFLRRALAGRGLYTRGSVAGHRVE